MIGKALLVPQEVLVVWDGCEGVSAHSCKARSVETLQTYEKGGPPKCNCLVLGIPNQDLQNS
eukprot:10297520-Ditylum_brightwellii.AAC.3